MKLTDAYLKVSMLTDVASTFLYIELPFQRLFGLLDGEGLPICCFVLPVRGFTFVFDLLGAGFEFIFPEGAETLLFLALFAAPAFSEAGFQSF